MLWYFIREERSGSVTLREHTTFAMGTVVSEKIYGGTEKTLEDVEALVNELDGKLSWRIEDSWIARLNMDKTMPLTDTFSLYMQEAFSLAEATKGAFDPTLRPLIALWDIEGSNPHVPSEDEMADCLRQIGYERVVLTASDITIPEDMTLDMGAVGKGIALDVLKDYFVKNRIPAATVAVGGSVLTYGTKPEGEWNIALQNPFQAEGTAMGVLHITGTRFISTSGDYEKYFEVDGIRYHHIFDRTTGYPADSGLSSVTILCDNGLVSDGLSTACFVMGYESSKSVLQLYGAEAVFVFQDGSVALTDGIKDNFELLDTDFHIE